MTTFITASRSSTVLARAKKSDRKGLEPAPPRITSNIKQNLQFLKLWTEYHKRKTSAPKPMTSYRKKKATKGELPDDTDQYQDPTTNLYYTNQGLETAVPVLLVDGYNMCGYWSKLKKHFMSGRLDVARQKLIDELISFSVLKELKVVVVFDAMMSGMPTHKEQFAGFELEAVVALKEDGCPKVWVVTSDSCQQQAAHGAGAFVWSCKALISEIKSSQKEFEQILRESRSTSVQGKLLKHNLDPVIVDALKDLSDSCLRINRNDQCIDASIISSLLIALAGNNCYANVIHELCQFYVDNYRLRKLKVIGRINLICILMH